VGGRVVLIDFDGTLAMRPGLWGGCVLELLDELEPGHGIELDRVRAGLRDGFPWHRADEPHPELSDPEAWWAPVHELIARAVVEAGLAPERAAALARAFRGRFCDPSRGWELFEDSIPALVRLREAGWRCVVLSNHVPELPALASGLGLSDHVDAIVTSATIGYEKPHPEAFRIALRAAGDPDQAWMVGDNPVADVGGAEALGLPAVLVRRPGEARFRAEDLHGAVDLILDSD
jgi:putative hydrolase of the HAD superfamily